MENNGNKGKIVLSASLEDSLTPSLKHLIAEVQRLSAEQQKISAALRNANIALDAHAKATEAAKRAAEEEVLVLQAKTAALRGDSAASKDATRALRERQQASLAAATGDEALARQVMDLRTQHEHLTQDLRQASNTLGMAFTAMGGVIVGAYGLAIKAAVDLDTAMIRVQKTTGLTDAATRELSAAFVEMSTRIPLSATALADIGAIAGQLGISGRDNLQAFTEVIAKLALATGMLPEAAAEGMAQLANIYKIPLKDLERLGSAMNELENATTATVPDLIDLMQRMGGKAVAVGFTAQQVAGLSATLKDLGINNEVAGTAMSQIFGKMLSDADKFAKQSGLSLSQWTDLINTKPLAALEVWLKKMKELDKFGRIAAIEKLGLDGEHASGLILKLADATDAMNKNIRASEQAYTDNVSLQREFETMLKGVEAQTTLLKNSFIAIAIEAGQTLLPFFSDVVSHVKDAVDWFRSLDDSTQTTIAFLGLGAGATVGLAGVLLLVIPQIYETVKAIQVVTGAIKAGKLAALGLNGALLANPFILIGTGLILLETQFGLVSGAVWGLYQFGEMLWEGLRDNLGPIVVDVKDKLAGLLERVGKFIKDIPVLGEVIEFTGKLWRDWGKATAEANPHLDEAIKNIKTGTTEAERHTKAVAAMQKALKGMSSQQEDFGRVIAITTKATEKATQEQDKNNRELTEAEKAAQRAAKAAEEHRRTIEKEALELKLKIAQLQGNTKEAASLEKQIVRLSEVTHMAKGAHAGQAKALQELKDEYARLQAQQKWNAEAWEMEKKLVGELPATHEGAVGKIIKLYEDRARELEALGKKEGADHQKILDLKAINENNFLVASEQAIVDHADKVLGIVREAKDAELLLESDTVAAILTNARLSLEERERLLKEYVGKVNQALVQQKDLEEVLAGRGIEIAQDEWGKKADVLNAWYDQYIAKVNDSSLNEEAKLLLVSQANQRRMEEAGRLQDEFDKENGSSWGLFSKTAEDALSAVGTLFRDGFTALIHGDLKGLGQAFISFFSSVLQAFERMLAEMLASGLLAKLKGVLGSIGGWLSGKLGGGVAEAAGGGGGGFLGGIGQSLFTGLAKFGIGTGLGSFMGAGGSFIGMEGASPLGIAQANAFLGGSGGLSSGFASTIGSVLSAAAVVAAIAAVAFIVISLVMRQKPPHQKLALGTSFEGLTFGPEGYTVGGIDVFVKGVKEISQKTGEQIAANLEKVLKASTTLWAMALNKLPRSIGESLQEDVEAANRAVQSRLAIIHIRSRKHFGDAVRNLIVGFQKAVAQEYWPAVSKGIESFFSAFLDTEKLKDLTGSINSLMDKLMSGGPNKLALLPEALNAVMATVEALDSKKALFNAQDMEAVTKALGQAFEDVNVMMGAGGLTKKTMEQIQARFGEFQAYLSAVVGFLSEQQAIIDQGTLSEFQRELKELRATLEVNRQKADELGLSHDKVNEAYAAQLLRLVELKAMEEEIARQTTPEMVLAMDGLIDWWGGMRERAEVLSEEMGAGLVGVEDFVRFVEAAQRLKEMSLEGLREKFITPFSDFIRSIDAMMGEQIDHLAEFNASLAGISTAEGLAKLGAAQEAIASMNAWFVSLGDFAGIAAAAAAKVLEFELSTLEGVQKRISELTGMTVTDAQTALDALRLLLEQAKGAPLEEREALLLKLEESLKLSERLTEQQIAAEEQAIRKWTEEQVKAIARDAENRDALLEEISRQEQAKLDALKAQAVKDAEGIIQVYRDLQSVAEAAAKEANERLVGMMEQVRDAVNAEKEALLLALESLAAGLGGLIQGEARAPHAKGLDFVPVDNYPASLHRGEAVITAQGNRGIAETNRRLDRIERRMEEAGGQQRGGVYHIHVDVDGRQISEVVFDEVRFQGEAGRKLIPSEAVYDR